MMGAMRLLGTLVLALTLALAGAGVAVAEDSGTSEPPPVSAVAEDPTSRTSEAKAALRAAEDLVGDKSTSEAAHQLSDGGEVTMALLDLWRNRPNLGGQDARTAARILARPGGTKVSCSTHFCVHYAPSNASASYVKTVRATMENVYSTYRKADYRMPPSDKGRGGNDKLDIYLQDLASQGYYGYCQPEEYAGGKGYAAYGFCVLDNDYDSSQYPSHTPKENLQVTAAHEFFHAVQFSYDVWEDSWIMEATATWAEDEVYPKVNDNIQYLPTSQLVSPKGSLDDPDAGGSNGLAVYGAWIFFRYLTEQRPAERGRLPRLIVNIWKQLDSTRGAKNNRYSMQGVQAAVKKADWNLDAAYAGFVSAALRPAKGFAEGSKYVSFIKKRVTDYTGAPATRIEFNGPGTVNKDWRGLKLRHMASASWHITGSSPAAVAGATFHVKFSKVSNWARMVLTTNKANGRRVIKTLKPKNARIGAAIDFDSATVDSIDLSLVNVSRKYTKCTIGGSATGSSCGGVATQNKIGLVGKLWVTN